MVSLSADGAVARRQARRPPNPGESPTTGGRMSRPHAHGALALLLGLVLAPAARPADDDPLKALQGTWVLTAIERDGEKGDDRVAKTLAATLTVTKGQFAFRALNRPGGAG